MKNRIITFCLTLLCCGNLVAQLPSGYIPTKSPITLVYKITDKEAGKLYRGKQKSLNEKMLHHCVDTLQGVADTLPKGYQNGHYLLVNAQGNHLHFYLNSVVPFNHQMLNNQRDMTLAVFDRTTGNPITDAKVKVDNKRLKFDTKTQSFRRKKTDKQGVLSIEAGGITAYYTVSRQYNLNTWKRINNGLWNAPAVKYLSRPVMFVARIPVDTYRSIQCNYPVGSIYRIQKPFADIFRSIADWEPEGWIENLVDKFDRYGEDNGFMVFSKPKYRPDDTIRFKAYVADKKGRPVKDSLSVYIRTDNRHKIGTIAPYRPGFYTMEFVPKSQHNMKLDKEYRLYLTNGSGFQGGYFYYEDYELKSIEYHIRAEKEEYLLHEEVIFYAKATDENNMPVDACVELTLLTDFISDFSGERVRVPDVLWKRKLTLDPVGETKIVVPDSIRVDASIGVQLIALFSNSDNQTERKDIRFVRKNSAESIVADQRADSLYIHYENRGQPATGMQVRIQRGLLSDTLVMLPARIKIHPLVNAYRIDREYVPPFIHRQPQPFAVFSFSQDNSGVSCSMNRARDSIFIIVDNPFGVPLNYTVFKGNSEQQRGTGKLSVYKAKAAKKDYFLSVQYVWGGKEYRLEYRSIYDVAQLQLHSSLPTVIFPGQTVKVNIMATDGNGNPVPNVDLTAWGFTAKFGEQAIPAFPSYQRPPSNRKAYNSFKSAELSAVSLNRELDFPQWREPLRLDSAELYHFAYPGKEIYRYSFPSADGQTYIAPYLVHDGKLLPIQILYIDDRPVYFGRTTTQSPYVFPVTEGIHMIRLRTNNFEVRARIEVCRGCKTFISIDPYQWNRKILETDGYNSWGRIDKKKSEYTRNELNLMQSYLMSIRYQPSGKFAWLQHGDTYEMLTSEKDMYWNGYKSGYGNLFVTNPVLGRTPITLWEDNKLIHTFERGNYQWSEYSPFPNTYTKQTVPFSHFDYNRPRFDWNTLPFTRQYIDSVLNKRNIEQQRDRIRYANHSKTPNSGRLQIEPTLNDSLRNEGWCWILYDYARDESLFYPLAERKFALLTDGIYALFLLMADKTFYLRDSVSLETGVTTMLYLPIEKMQRSTQPIDSCLSHRSLLRDINAYGGTDVVVPPKPRPIKTPMSYNPEYITDVEVCGTVTDENGEALPGVNIIVKGTTNGVVSDINGNYCIRVPQGYRTLIYSFIGYITVEQTPLQSGYVNVTLQESLQALDEVIVVGFGTQRKSNLTGSVSSVLTGRVAGVSVSHESADEIRIRGISSLNAGSQPLYVVDGVILTDISRLPPGSIASMNILKDASAMALYGARGANGVVVITTNGGIASMDVQNMMKQILEDEAYQSGLVSAKGLRTNFADEAFWQPILTTDHAGVASFTATFPDDVTKWNLRFVGILPGKASAGTQTQVRSFKPLMGQLAVPRFLVEGDTANVIGKIINYGQDTVRLNTNFAVNSVSKAFKTAAMRHLLTDTLTVTAPEIDYDFHDFLNSHRDSIAVRYQLTREDGYQDGEERYIPVYRRGTTEAVGHFHVLDTDTIVTLTFEDVNVPITLSLESSSLDVLMKETRRLRDYQHLCDEQTASRLKALLLERKAYQLQGKDYPYDKHIRSLIDRLIKGRNEQGLWGWFGGAQETWISTHVVEALLQARDDSFVVNIDFENTTNRLILNFDNAANAERVRLLNLLVRINPESNYRAMFDMIDSNSFEYDADLLRFMELSLHFGEKLDIEKLLQRQITDKFGNIHWSETGKRHWQYNDVAVTLAAYRLLRACDGHDRMLLKIRNYLFAQRKHYGWQNTYETANILSTIMPDILASGDSIGNPRVRIGRDVAGYISTIDTFPKHITLNGGEPIIIDKKGSFPVYVTAWQEIYRRDPEPANEGFRVETRFLPDMTLSATSQPDRSSFDLTGSADLSGSKSMLLPSRKPATLEVTVSSDVSSEYVMIEIPIPAGCSYQSKLQSWYRGMGETHREYFRDRVCIYLRNMSKGAHTFRVELMPRFTGVYHVNPAKAERMYLPLYYGRTEMKRVKIED